MIRVNNRRCHVYARAGVFRSRLLLGVWAALVVASAAPAAAQTPVPAPPAVDPNAVSCPDASRSPTEAGAAVVENAILCEVNAYRKLHGRGALRPLVSLRG